RSTLPCLPNGFIYHRARVERKRRLLHGLIRLRQGYGGQDQSSFCTSNQTKAESIPANVDNTNVARFVCRILKAGLGISSRSEEHTSELQSLAYLVCRLLLEKKKKKK